MDVQVDGDTLAITLPRLEFLLLVNSLNEHILVRGDKFSVLGFDLVEADELADAIASRTGAARRAALSPTGEQAWRPPKDYDYWQEAASRDVLPRAHRWGDAGMKDVQITGDRYTLKIPRIGLMLLAQTLDEHLLFDGPRFEVVGFGHDEAEEFADELASRTGIAGVKDRDDSEHDR